MAGNRPDTHRCPLEFLGSGKVILRSILFGRSGKIPTIEIF